MIRNRYKLMTLIIGVIWIIGIILFTAARRNLYDIYTDISNVKVINGDNDSIYRDGDLSEILRVLMSNNSIQIEDIENGDGEGSIFIKYIGNSDGLNEVLDELQSKNKSISVEKIIFENNELNLKMKYK